MLQSPHSQAESRNNGVSRQPLTVTKERDLPKDSNADSEIAEEKIRRLPAGGEGWDKIKMKRKRSVGAVFPRPVDNDGELKRTMHHKLTSESTLQSGDSAHNFRLGSITLYKPKLNRCLILRCLSNSLLSFQ